MMVVSSIDDIGQYGAVFQFVNKGSYRSCKIQTKALTVPETSAIKTRMMNGAAKNSISRDAI
ncbi:hypothetical protein [Fluviicola taffensis]|uniref:hypothetical protein n=1 Tax=Fluviicola taffensis TaxID=191579 RepID=UPI003137F722